MESFKSLVRSFFNLVISDGINDESGSSDDENNEGKNSQKLSRRSSRGLIRKSYLHTVAENVEGEECDPNCTLCQALSEAVSKSLI